MQYKEIVNQLNIKQTPPTGVNGPKIEIMLLFKNDFKDNKYREPENKTMPATMSLAE